MNIDTGALRDALQAWPGECDDDDKDLAVEKMGDPAFDWIVGQLREGSLSAKEAVRGLRLLARLTRQFCVGRKGELLDIALTISQEIDAAVDVRSTAAHLAVMNAQIAKGLVHAEAVYGRSVDDVQLQVSGAVGRALELGLTEETEAFVKEYLRGMVQLPG